MTQVQQKVYLITEQQRDALLSYLQDRPYREVANGVQFLSNAPTTVVNLEVPNEQGESISAAQEPQSPVNTQEEEGVEIANAPTEELGVFSHA